MSPDAQMTISKEVFVTGSLICASQRWLSGGGEQRCWAGLGSAMPCVVRPPSRLLVGADSWLSELLDTSRADISVPWFGRGQRTCLPSRDSEEAINNRSGVGAKGPSKNAGLVRPQDSHMTLGLKDKTKQTNKNSLPQTCRGRDKLYTYSLSEGVWSRWKLI